LFSRVSTTRKSAKRVASAISRPSTPGRNGRQFASSGASLGAVTISKSRAPALLLKKNRSPWS
jgi:hypothetical protein